MVYRHGISAAFDSVYIAIKTRPLSHGITAAFGSVYIYIYIYNR